MPCHFMENVILCTNRVFRLRLNDGRYQYMEWHDYLGPVFWNDRNCTKETEKWWEDPDITDALDWFQRRGKKA